MSRRIDVTVGGSGPLSDLAMQIDIVIPFGQKRDQDSFRSLSEIYLSLD